MAHPLMPKATAVWLVENTALTFEQIAAFCGLHDLEVQAIADGEVATGMQGLDPIAGGELTQEELDRCAADPDSRMEMAKPNIPLFGLSNLETDRHHQADHQRHPRAQPLEHAQH